MDWINDNMTNKQLIAKSLILWRNYIETGDPCLSRIDLSNMKRQDEIKVLSDEQLEFCLRLQKLSDKILQS